MTVISELFDESGMSVQEFADKAGLKYGTAYDIAKGKAKPENIGAGVFVRVAHVLGRSAEELLDGAEPPSKADGKGSPTTVRENIAAGLKAARKAAKMSVTEVGAALGKSGKTISAWEVGRGQPDGDETAALCKLLGTSVADLYGEEYERLVLGGSRAGVLRPDEAELVERYRDLPESDRADVLKAVRLRWLVRLYDTEGANVALEECMQMGALGAHTSESKCPGNAREIEFSPDEE